jgi:hypothetical protein
VAQGPEEERTQIGTFGDIKIETADLNEPDKRRVMVLSKNQSPFLLIFENPSGLVEEFGVMNGRYGNVAHAQMNSQGISGFGVFGNSVNGRERMGVLFMKASTKTPGRWQSVKYAPTTEPGKEGYYRVTGEVYDDIDFNGPFDAKRVYNSESELVSMSLHLYGQWQEILRINADSLFLKVGKCYPDKGTAFSTQGEQRTHYRFQPGAGWQIEKIDRAGVGWPPDPNDPMNRGQRRDDITRIKSEQDEMWMRLPEAK